MPLRFDENDRVKITSLADYRKKEGLQKYLNRVGTVINVNSSYQAPDMLLVVFSDEKGYCNINDRRNFFEHEVTNA